MVPFAYEHFIGNLTQMVKSGAIPMSRIDDAVTRILRVKFQMGLFERPFGDGKLEKNVGQEVRSLPTLQSEVVVHCFCNSELNCMLCMCSRTES
jgi:beta-glucosidase-like glycosyl hydrolase